MNAVKRYLSEIGRRGGSAKSERKTQAARRNAKKGGRPRLAEHLVTPAALKRRETRAKT